MAANSLWMAIHLTMTTTGLAAMNAVASLTATNARSQI